ncbi:MAG TPA: HEPN domain-containing protein [Isosphaeraceae bacterium]|nr:HEPN domain-containing protein [Isosphaeraceae bacterium]
MRFLPDHYVEAASERIEPAVDLFRIGHYSLALDTAGRAVECLLRAYFFRRNGVDAKLEGAHDILKLFRASGLKEIALGAHQRRGDSEGQSERFGRALGADIHDVGQIWSDDLRYASESRLRTHLRQMNLHRGVKGDFLKFNAQRLVEAARRIVAEGVERWSDSKRK